MNSINDEVKDNLLNRLKRVEGQIRGLQRMIDEEKYCVDILTQVVAARGALKKIGLIILDQHTNGCVRNAIKDEQDADQIINELMDVFAKFTD